MDQKGLLLLLCALLLGVMVGYVVYRSEWMLYGALGVLVVLIVSLMLGTASTPPTSASKSTVIHRHKDEFAQVVTDLVAEYTASGRSTGEGTVEEELSSLIADAMELGLEQALSLDKRLAQGDADPTVESIRRFMIDDMSEEELLRMGGGALWGSSVQA